MKFEVNGKVIPTNVKYRTTINGKTVDLTEVSANGKTVWKYVPPYVPPSGHWQLTGNGFRSPTDVSNGSTIRCTPTADGAFSCHRYVWVPNDEPEPDNIDIN